MYDYNVSKGMTGTGISKEQFGLNTFWWETLHNDEQIKACVDCVAKTGFRYVEFKRASFLPEQLARQFRAAVRATEAAGLKVSNFVVLRDLVTGGQQAVDDVVETIVSCAETGVNILNAVFGAQPAPIAASAEDWWMPPQTDHQSGWDTVTAALETICAAAERCQVHLAMEPTTGTLVHDYYTLQEVFRRFDHPCLGVTMDPSHLFIHRNDIPYAIGQLADKIKHVHLKDAVGHPGVIGQDFTFLPPGAGGIDWVSFFQALDTIGYRGALSGEYEQFKYMGQLRRNDPEYMAQVMFNDMNALYDFVYG